MNLAIIGATGNVGRKTIEILEKSKIEISNLFLVASSKSAGKKIKFKGKEIEVQNIELPVEIVQTMMTAFVLLEFGHRIKIGNIVMPKGRNIPDIFSNSFISIKTVVTTTELDKLRATSEELMASFRLILDGIVIFTLLSVIGLQNTFEYFSSEEWLARVLSIYSLILISQLVTRSRS